MNDIEAQCANGHVYNIAQSRLDEVGTPETEPPIENAPLEDADWGMTASYSETPPVEEPQVAPLRSEEVSTIPDLIALAQRVQAKDEKIEKTLGKVKRGLEKLLKDLESIDLDDESSD